ncbi:hypothetical protein LR48_Vigan04g085900 [Vigna angularis]|uniref:Uncharacterized protein n=1 Tax=Phaseolus angularis TaxID=3914 RepID=A0A0L9UD71_PHAAN|nr:hypothetical protein LR48_Vigan04g085900 [Vigna angularis]
MLIKNWGLILAAKPKYAPLVSYLPRQNPNPTMWIGRAKAKMENTTVDLKPHGEDLSSRVHQLPSCVKHDGPASVSHYFKPKHKASLTKVCHCRKHISEEGYSREPLSNFLTVTLVYAGTNGFVGAGAGVAGTGFEGACFAGALGAIAGD